MANFLENLSEYNAKAAVAISAAVVERNNEKANMMSSLKTTANDVTLSEEVRLNALTALINLGNLLDIPLPPYFPSITTYALTETYVGVHDDLEGIQGGAPGQYYHLTEAERDSVLNKASLGDITWENLGGVYSDNDTFGPQFDAKQNALSAPGVGTYFVKVTGNTVSYDNSTYITSTSLAATPFTGELSGTIGNPTLSNAAVIGKVLTGWNGSATGTITSSDTILSALQKLNGNLNAVIASPGGVASVAFTNNATSVFTTTASPSTGAASLNLSLNTQTANLVLASPNGTTGQPSFRSLLAADLPNSGVSAGTYGSSTVIPQIQVDAKGRITGVTAVTAASGGQVNTITLAVPSFLGLSSINNTLPASPQIVLQLATQTANTVFAGPATGAAAAPTFRLLQEADIPQLSTSKITGLTNILNNFLTNNISDGSIWIGNTSNAAVPRVLSGDVTVSNTGVTTIGAAKVQYSMIQNVTSQTLLGNYELTDGPVQQITLSALDFVLDDVTGVLSLQNPVAPVVTAKGDLLGHNTITQARVPSNNIDGSILLVNNSATGAYTDLGLNWVAMSGDATITALGAITIANNAVTLAKMATLPAFTVIGNATSGIATPTALSRTELTALVEQFTASASGAVPATGAAAGDATKFLNAAGGWTVPAGGGGGSGTVGNGNQYQLAYYNGAGTTTSVIGWTAPTANRALVSDGNGLPIASATTAAEIGFVSGVTSSIQTQLNGKAVYPGIGIPNSTGSAWGTSYGVTGTGSVVLDTSPTLATPTLGVASATSINKVAITAPATSATLTIANGKTLTASNTLTFTGADGSSVNFPGNGTAAYTTTSNSWSAGVKQTFAPDATNAGINVGSLAGDPSSPVNGDIVYNSNSGNLRAYIAGAWVSLGSGGGGGVASFSAGTTGFLPSSATTGAITLTGTLNVANGGTGATTLSGLLRGNGISPITGSALVGLASEVSGTLLVGNGGTGITTNTAFAVVLGGTTNGGALTQVVGVGNAGQVLTSNGAGLAPTWQTGGATVALNSVVGATASATRDHTNWNITWNWSTATTTNAFVLNSVSLTTASLLSITHSTSALTGNLTTITSTGVTTGNLLSLGISGATATSAKNLVITNTSTTASSTTRGLDIQLSGNNTSGNTIAAFISNTKGGTTSTTTALQLTASGGTTISYAIDVLAGISRFAAGTASAPQIILSPSSALGLSGTTDGSIWYDTTANNSSIILRKLYASGLGIYTKVITKDYNPDFATGTTSGIIVSDSSGTLTKSADLTALGIFAASDTTTIANTATTATTMVSTSLAGSKTLPANFFGVGKTIEFKASGTYTLSSSTTTGLTFRVSLGGTLNIDVVLSHNNSITTQYFEFVCQLTCSAISGTNSTYTYSARAIGQTTSGTNAGANVIYGTAAKSASLAINTTATIATDIQAFFGSNVAGNTISVQQATATYLN